MYQTLPSSESPAVHTARFLNAFDQGTLFALQAKQDVGGDRATRLVKAHTVYDVMNKRGSLYAQFNSRGYAIFIRPAVAISRDPISGDLVRVDDHRYIYIDMDSNAPRNVALALTMNPFMIVETSFQHLQAWYRLPVARRNAVDAYAATKYLAGRIEGDNGAIGVRQMGRLPGFANMKAKHARHESRFMVKVVLDVGGDLIDRHAVARLPWGDVHAPVLGVSRAPAAPNRRGGGGAGSGMSAEERHDYGNTIRNLKRGKPVDEVERIVQAASKRPRGAVHQMVMTLAEKYG
jgi:hypothetical protein